MLVKTIKVSDKGQISIPIEIRELTGIKTGDELIMLQDGSKILIERPEKIIKEDFKNLLKHSEEVANKLWSNKEDEIWDTI